jgi:2-polyprenyl-3-methyl-5-hydroxy-6-metoxy-1,4-benzoquinol methylase
MSDVSRKTHWESVYTTKGEREVSWFQENPAPSLELIALAGLSADAAIIDIGGGASRLVDALVERKIGKITVLDLSAAALDTARERLGDKGADVNWVVADVTTWSHPKPTICGTTALAFHFLTDASDRSAYIGHLKKAVRPGGHVVIGTFAPAGPERCSGLPVMRYDANTLGAIFGAEFNLLDSRRHDHATPWGAVQRFQFSTFRRN